MRKKIQHKWVREEEEGRSKGEGGRRYCEKLRVQREKRWWAKGGREMREGGGGGGRGVHRGYLFESVNYSLHIFAVVLKNVCSIKFRLSTKQFFFSVMLPSSSFLPPSSLLPSPSSLLPSLSHTCNSILVICAAFNWSSSSAFTLVASSCSSCWLFSCFSKSVTCSSFCCVRFSACAVACCCCASLCKGKNYYVRFFVVIIVVC